MQSYYIEVTHVDASDDSATDFMTEWQSIEAANAIQVKATLNEAKRAGLTLDKEPPEEGGYSETLNCVTCSHCYQ